MQFCGFSMKSFDQLHAEDGASRVSAMSEFTTASGKSAHSA
jgi:hypothetical protein